MDEVRGGGLYQYVYGVGCCACCYTSTCMVWPVDKYEGVMQRRACSRRSASASEGRECVVWGGLGGVDVHVFYSSCRCVHRIYIVFVDVCTEFI